MVDYNARLYDPGLGRFLSVDPLIAHPEGTQSINPYSYVEDNPLNKTDPTGEASTQCVGSGKNKTCKVTPPKLPTPTGSHIPQKPTTVGNLVCTSADCNSAIGVSPGGGRQGAKATGATFDKATHQQSGGATGAGDPGGAKNAADGMGFHKSIAMGKLTKAEQKIKDQIDKQLYRYYEAIKAKGDLQALKEYERTIVKFDPNFVGSVNSPDAIAYGCHNCDITHAEEATGHGTENPNYDTIVLGPQVITYMRDSHNPAYEYPPSSGIMFHPGPNGPLEVISHEFGHTFSINGALSRSRNSMVEFGASLYMEQLEPYFPPH